MFDEKDWEIFKQKLKKRTGIDLDLYKAAQMQRRIGNLMQRNGHTSYAAFFDSI
ncbi:MAG: CheR family methyltransferase, partial [Selenomonadaceae bacterium]